MIGSRYDRKRTQERNQNQLGEPDVSNSDAFELYDLRVEVVAGEKEMVCNHMPGDYFELHGENLSLPPGQSFPIYPLAALLPLLPAKQRPTAANDWMTTDAEVACPDPHCGARFRIVRTGRSVFRHGEVTRVPLRRGGGELRPGHSAAAGCGKGAGDGGAGRAFSGTDGAPSD